MSAPQLSDFLGADALADLLERARAEDIPAGDATSSLLVDAGRSDRALLHARAAGTLCGSALLPELATRYDRRLEVALSRLDGDTVEPGTAVAEIAGPTRSLLAVERVALNFLTHLSGIATLTSRCVSAAAGTGAAILDTRKTLPGLRALEKYAVACGGGRNHRASLSDAVLIKDNHLAGVPAAELAPRLADAVARARELDPPPAFVEIEADTRAQLDAVLAASPDIALLDNMDRAALRDAVARRDAAAPHVRLEASGGLGPETVAEIAATGVDRIAIGALTHSAPALDIGMDIAGGATA